MTFKNISIKTKLIVLIFSVSMFIIFLGMVINSLLGTHVFKKELTYNTTLNANLIGEYCVSPLSFDEDKGAASILEKLRTIPAIEHGYVYDKKGRFFAAYHRTDGAYRTPPPLPSVQAKFQDELLHVVQPIFYKDEKYGSIYLVASTLPLKNRITNYRTGLLGLGGVLLFLSFLLARSSHHIISRPILKLAQRAREITEKKDYTLQVSRPSDDEIGYLYDNFNDMLATVNQQQTERNAAEQALRESEKKYRRLFTNSMVGVGILDDKANLCEANHALLTMLQMTQEKNAKCNLVDYLANRKAKNIFRRIFNDGGQVEEFETQIITRSGSRRWINTSVSPVTISNRRSFLITAHDIDDRKRSEEKISQLHQVFTQLGVDPQKNIDFIVEQTALIIKAACSIYNKIDCNGTSIMCFSGYQLPKDYARQDAPQGHICFEATMSTKDQPVAIHDLTGTIYEKSDPNVKKYHLKSYLGHPVNLREKTIGSLCIVDTQKRKFQDIDLYVISTLAQALSLEEERHAANEQIEKDLQEKKLLLQEIHHRVKNNLQIVSSLLSLQSRQKASAQNRELFRVSQSRIRSMALVHEKLYQSPDLAKVDIVDYIKSLATTLYRTYHVDSAKIGLSLDINDIPLGIDKAVPVGLLLNELMSNALKHAFPPSFEDYGEIYINLEADQNGSIELTVADNGTGLPKDFDIEKTDSLGLHIVSILTKDQLDGELEVQSSEGKTAFIIRFKENLS